MGLPLIATPVIAGVFGPRAAVVIVSIPVFVTNSLLIVAGWRSIPGVLRELLPMLVLGAVGTLFGVQLLAKMDEKIFAVVISAIVIAFLLRGDRLLGDEPGSRRVKVAGPIVGLVGGILQGSTSIASPLVGSYFHARKVAPAAFVVSLASLFELNSIIQIGSLVGLRLFTPDLVALGVVGLVPNLIGLLVGIEMRGRVSPVTFRRIIVALLIVSVLNLMRTVVR
ncbi:MAG: TSUP family transporter [Chloroflexi bacterium]|nr:TSUP family transporter [Chloroflexota bacterium]